MTDEIWEVATRDDASNLWSPPVIVHPDGEDLWVSKDRTVLVRRWRLDDEENRR